MLASHNVNVREFESAVEAASMGGGEIFRATAELLVPLTTDIDVLEAEIEAIANDLMVDISFRK